MTTYLENISRRYQAETHHCFVLHGGTRDLQLGSSGSCTLVQHCQQFFTAASRLVVTFRAGIGWSFVVESDQADFTALVGLAGQAAANPFAALGVGSATGQQQADDLPIDVGEAIGLIDAAMRQSDRPVVMIVDRAELVCPMTGYDRMTASDKAVLSMLQALAADRAVESTRNILLLITDSLTDLHETLRLASSRYYAVEILPPDYTERLGIAQQVFPQLGSLDCQIDLTEREFAAATSMMTRYGLMDVLLDAKAAGKLTKDQVRQVKQQVMSQEYGDILEVLTPIEAGYKALAGQAALKQVMTGIVQNMIAGDLADVPAGLLFAGAAGLGKSYFMACTAGQLGIPVINLNIGRILGSFVGQSERNLERALSAIRAAAPCLVVLDEIETTFPDRASSGPSGDSGVSSRILKRMLEELSSSANRGKVCWIGITNYPEKLDAALSRAGRFDVVVAFLPPTESERADLLALYSAKYNCDLPAADVLAAAAKALAGYTNAELENVVRKARQVAATEKLPVDQCWQAAIQRVRANTRSVQQMTDSALLAVNDADLLPAEYITRWKALTGQQDQAAGQAAPEVPARKSLF